MIGRTNRFHGRGGLKRLYANSKSARTGALALRYVPNERRDSYRLAVVVSRKVSKSAVVRNRIRRRTYENVRILSGSFKTPCDIVLLVYDERVADMPAHALAADIAKLLQKAGILERSQPEHDIVNVKE